MRPLAIFLLISVSSCLGLITCVDPAGPISTSSLQVVIVDGNITNLTEPQIVRLSLSHPDPVTGRFGQIPLSGATVRLIVDSVQVVVMTETDAGRYQAPDGFKGQVNHAYQLRFTLRDGTDYRSSVERLQPVAQIDQIRAQFNPRSLTSTERLNNVYTAAYDFYVDFTDPADQTNYYRWDWKLWERQAWCRSCQGGKYQIMDAQGKLVEDCVNERFTYPKYDYNCRTTCWEIIYGNDLTLLSDRNSDGNSIKALRIAQVPLYSKEHCLVEIRQTSLTQTAYTYFNQLDEQTRNAGSVAAAQPALLVGNIRNLAHYDEPVVGYFVASAVSVSRHWLTRSDATGFAPGLFQALNGRDPSNEPSDGARYRPPLAVCVSSDNRTPFKPNGWRD